MLHSYAKIGLAPQRDAVILELCRNKRVMHLGAADSPYTKEKVDSGLLLHAALSEVSSEVVGIDLDRDAIDYLKGQGFDNIVWADVNRLESFPIEPEVIVMGETIEHLGDPGTSLDGIRQLMAEDSRLVISTPNLLSLYNGIQVFKNRETQHPDHKVGFTLGLLEQLLRGRGLTVDRAWFTFLDRSRMDWKGRLWRSVARLRPGLAETLLVVCSKDNAVS